MGSSHNKSDNVKPTPAIVRAHVIRTRLRELRREFNRVTDHLSAADFQDLECKIMLATRRDPLAMRLADQCIRHWDEADGEDPLPALRADLRGAEVALCEARRIATERTS